MLTLVELGQFAAEVCVRFRHDLFGALRVGGGEHPGPVLGHEDKRACQVKTRSLLVHMSFTQL